MRKVTRDQVRQMVKEYEHNQPYLKRLLRKVFSYPENIDVMGWFIYPHHHTLRTPVFHREVLELALEVTNGYNVGIAAPRGSAKSTVVNLNLLTWLVANERYHFILVVSDTITQSAEFVNTFKDEIETNERLKWLYGGMIGDTWQSGKIVTANGVKVMARGYGSKIRGLKFQQYRPELMIVDDLENDESVESSDQREKLKRWFTRAAMRSLAKGCKAIVIGTILHGDSLLMQIIKREGEFSAWKTRLYKFLNYKEDVKGKKIWFSLWPSMYSTEKLVSMRDDPEDRDYMGSLVFASEMQNEPVDTENAIIKPEWILRSEVLPAQSVVVRKAISVDPAISKRQTANFTGKVFGVLTTTGDLYITRIGNDRLSFLGGIKDIRKWHEDLKPSYIAIESIAFAKAYSESLKGLPIREIQVDTDKVRRLMKVSKWFEAGKVHIQKDIKNADLAIDQLTHFPSVAHDDLVDAISQLVDIMLNNSVGTYKGQKKKESPKPSTAGLKQKRF